MNQSTTAHRPLSTASRLAAAAAALGLLAFAGPVGNAGVIYWDGSSAAWGTAANWSTASNATSPEPAAFPGASDDAVFNISTVNNAETITLDAARSVNSLTFNNTSATSLTGGTASRILTLGAGGVTINNGAGAVTFGNGGTSTKNVIFALGATQQTWTNNSTSNLTIANSALAAFTRSTGGTLTFNQASSGIFSMTTTHLPNANSIVGPWAFFGTGASTKYAYNNAGTIAGFAGTAAATAANLTDTTGAVNYDLADATGVIGAANFSGNTLRYTGAAATLAPGATSFTVNGLLNAGSGLWTIGTNNVTIGSGKELVVNTASDNIAISSVITDNAGGVSALTKSGSRTLTLANTNTYTGVTTVGEGTLILSGGDGTVGTIGNTAAGAVVMANNTTLQLRATGANTAGGVSTALTSAANTNQLFTASSGTTTFQLRTDSSVTFASGVGISGISGTASVVNFDIDAINAGNNDKTVTFTGFNYGKALTMNVTGNSGDRLVLGTIGDVATGGGITTFNPTINMTVGALMITTAATSLVLDGTSNDNIILGTVTSNNSGRLFNITKSNSSTWSLNGDNSLSNGKCSVGTISITGGTLKIGGNGQLTTYAVSTGTFGRTIAIGDGTTFDYASTNTQTLSGVISGGGELKMSGAGKLVLSNAANTMSGRVTLSNGTLSLGSNAALGTGTLTITGGTLDVTAASTTTNNNVQEWNGDFTFAGTDTLDLGTGAVTMNANRKVTVTASTLTVGGAIGGSGYSLTKDGNGALTLAGANTYTGDTILTGSGALKIANSSALGSTGALKLQSTQAGSAATVYVSGGITVGNAIVIDPSTGRETIVSTGSGNNSLTGGITINGAGLGGYLSAIILMNNQTTGNLTVSGGVTGADLNNSILSLRGSNTSGTSTLDGRVYLPKSIFDINGDANWTITNTSGSSSSWLKSQMMGGLGNLILGNHNALATTAYVAWAGSSGALDLAGYDQSVAGLSTASASFTGLQKGTVTNNSASNDSILTLANLSGNYSFGGVISTGTGSKTISLVMDSAGKTQTLTGINTYSGKTTIKAGTLAIDNLDAAGANGELDLNVQNGASGILDYIGAAGTFGKNITALGTGTQIIQNGGTGLLTLSGTLTKDGTKLTLKGGANGITVNGGGIVGSSANSDLIIDSGVTTLASANTYNGPTYIRNGATLHADATNALPTANGRSAVILDDIGTGNSTLALGANQSIASLSGVVGSSVNLNDKTLTIGAASGSTTFGGVISGSGGALVKDLASTLVLTGSNSFTGGTTVTGGTLLLTGSLDSGVTVSGSGTLAGDGKVNGAVTISGIVSPGDTGTIGTLATTGTTILDGTSKYVWEVNKITGIDGGNQNALKGTNFDFLNIIGGLTINSGFTIDVTALGAVENWNHGKYGSYWTIASASGGITLGSGIDLTTDLRNQTGVHFLFTGFGSGQTNDYSLVPAGFTEYWYLEKSSNGNDLVLHYVPEPGTLSLLVFGALALLGRRRRDRR